MKDETMPINTCVDGLAKVREEISRVIVGQEEVIELTLIALLCEGHALFEGVPGLGKTMLVRALADTLQTSFSRVQFTPDLMPADVIGMTMLQGAGEGNFDLKFEPGPIFASVVLADEINRASPKTQSALLEAMQDRTVTVRGRSYPLPKPFLVLATQNPLEMEGTYPLPEAQIDRFFFKIIVPQPGKEDLDRILERTVGASSPRAQPVMREVDVLALQRATREVVAPPPVLDFASRLVLATQPEHPDSPARVRRFVRYGAGPRGAQSLVLAAKARALIDGRFNASVADLERCALPALRHRVALNFEGQSEGLKSEALIQDALEAVRAAREFAPELR
jgi:MoxR-like ATPase